MKDIDALCINTIRFLAVDAVERAKSGHPGMPMGDAPMAYVLWTRFLRHNPANPCWPGRDRFVLSAGHGSMLLYSLLHLTGYELSLEELKNFRQWGSKTPGHPEYHPEIGIETTTGPLGQGFANGVGMAMAQRYLAERYNRQGFPLFDYNIYAIVSDGDIMEGVSNEAASIAGHLKLGSLVYLYSDNRITIEGSTELTFTEDVEARFRALGWHTQRVDGYDLDAIEAAIKEAKETTDRPSIILVRTHIGYGSPHKQDTPDVHGAPLGKEEVIATKKHLGWPLEPEFYIPDEVLTHMRKAVERGRELEESWQRLFDEYAEKYPELAAEIKGIIEGNHPSDWKELLPQFSPEDGGVATRKASGKVLNSIAEKTPFLIGGSADLAPSNNTYMKGVGDFLPNGVGRNIHYGIREHAMGAIMNGLALAGLVPFGGTFLVFSDYMRPAIRMAAMSGLHVIYVFTHDSIGLGEDGPTHQPIEHIASLRAMPNLVVIRPADASETVTAWKVALERKDGPTALLLTRQGVPVIDRAKYGCSSPEDLEKGAYVIADCDDTPELILIATGSEVHLALEAWQRLKDKGIRVRVVNMPSWELFEMQDKEYREDVLPPSVRARVSIEAGSTLGWHRYTGSEGVTIGIDRFGASAPYKILFEKFGFTAENIENEALKLLEKMRS